MLHPEVLRSEDHYPGGIRLMESIFSCCADLDVHKKTVDACVRRLEPDGPNVKFDEVEIAGLSLAELLAAKRIEDLGAFGNAECADQCARAGASVRRAVADALAWPGSITA